jgi:murein DD-endopeptidase MepM/ murein hydrolase activator NlpD
LLLVSALAITLAYFAVFYTSLKLLMPGYPSPEVWKSIHYNQRMTDSLVAQIEMRDSFLFKIKGVFTGEIVDDTTYLRTGIAPTKIDPDKIDQEPIFDKLIGPEVYKFSFNESSSADELERINFFPPISGVVINRFNSSPGHFGTDIVGRLHSNIYAILDGTVIFAEWSISTGYAVHIQHKYNLVSVYKHNSEVLVKQGDKVKSGEVIAIMGNEGELSTGPHLHFELWRNGTALDPEQYINF